MADLEPLYPDAIPTARRELDAIAAFDSELAGLAPEQLQAPIETRRKAATADALPEDGSLPVKKAEVIEFDTEHNPNRRRLKGHLPIQLRLCLGTGARLLSACGNRSLTTIPPKPWPSSSLAAAFAATAALLTVIRVWGPPTFAGVAPEAQVSALLGQQGEETALQIIPSV